MTRVAYRAALALLLAGNAAGLAVLAQHVGGMPPLLGAVALAYAGAVVLVYALGAAWGAGCAAGRRTVRRRRWRPSGRRVVPGGVLSTQRARAAAEELAHAEAMAAVGAEPMPAPTMAYTVTMQPVGGIVERFDGRAVGDAAPGVWTAPVSAPGRHAGTVASDLSEWGAFEYGGTR